MQAPRSSQDLAIYPLFRGFTPTELETAFALLAPRQLRARTSLALGREFKGKIGFAWHGGLRLIGVSPLGRMITLFPLEPGEPFAYTPGLVGGSFGPPIKLAADTPALVLEADAAALTDLILQSPRASRAFLTVMSRRLLDYGARLYELATLDGETRLCSELLRLSARGEWVDGKCILSPRPSRAAIAMQISIAQEAVSRGLKELARKGIVTVERSALVLHDVSALQETVRQRSGAFFTPQAEPD